MEENIQAHTLAQGIKLSHINLIENILSQYPCKEKRDIIRFLRDRCIDEVLIKENERLHKELDKANYFFLHAPSKKLKKINKIKGKTLKSNQLEKEIKE